MHENKIIDFEFRIVGDRRGGQHAVIEWLFGQFNGIIYWKNNGMSGHDVLKMSGFPDISKFSSWSGHDKFIEFERRKPLGL